MLPFFKIVICLGARSGPKQKNLECSFAEKLQVKVKHKTIYASGYLTMCILVSLRCMPKATFTASRILSLPRHVFGNSALYR